MNKATRKRRALSQIGTASEATAPRRGRGGPRTPDAVPVRPMWIALPTRRSAGARHAGGDGFILEQNMGQAAFAGARPDTFLCLIMPQAVRPRVFLSRATAEHLCKWLEDGLLWQP